MIKHKVKIQTGKGNKPNKPILISIDKHSKSSYLFGCNIETGEIVIDKNLIGGNAVILKHLKKCNKPDQIEVLLEAGNHGFSTYRKIVKHGYNCHLIAPTSIPKRGKEKKTDRDDSIANLHYGLAGLLSYVHVPTVEDEDAREGLRYRYEQIWRQTKQKQKISALLKRHDQEYSLTKSLWTKTYYNWLKNIELYPSTRLVLDMMLEELEWIERKVADVDTKLDILFKSNHRYRMLLSYYQLIPGIGRVGSMTLVLEGGDLKRFSHPGKVMNYVGVIPQKHSSGKCDPNLCITKAGNKYLRLAMVGAAKYYRDRRFLVSHKKLSQMAPPISEFLKRCQSRLNTRYRYLRDQHKHSNKVKVAIARELCGFIWDLAINVIPIVEDAKKIRKVA